MNRIAAYVLMLICYFAGCLIGNTFSLTGTTAYINIAIALAVFTLFSAMALVSSIASASAARKKKRLAKMIPPTRAYYDRPHH